LFGDFSAFFERKKEDVGDYKAKGECRRFSFFGIFFINIVDFVFLFFDSFNL